MTSLTCSFEFSGYSDYWSGMSDRGCGHGAAFAFYNSRTTLRDIVDQWVEESWCNEHDFADLPESVTSDDIRDCILESLTPSGRADYDSGALCEWAVDCEDTSECRECGAGIGCEHESDCDYRDDSEEWGAIVVEGDCDDYDGCCESPIAIIEIDWTDHPDYKKCPDCGGKFDPDGVDGLCSDCTNMHYGEDCNG